MPDLNVTSQDGDNSRIRIEAQADNLSGLANTLLSQTDFAQLQTTIGAHTTADVSAAIVLLIQSLDARLKTIEHINF